MYEYSFDHVRAMTRAYQALAAGDRDGFAKPLAPAIALSVIAEIIHGADASARDARVVATDFQYGKGRLQVTGHYQAIALKHGTPIIIPFRHEWDFMYGVASGFTQHLGAARPGRAVVARM